MRFLVLVVLSVLTLVIPVFAYDWAVVPDRMNNPVYSGPSGLSCEVTADSVHIFGVNTDTPFGAGPREAGLLWPGISAESMSSYTNLSMDSTVTLSGSGIGYMYGITLWESATRYIMYGLDYDGGVFYRPSRWIAIPGGGPGWDTLGNPISNPNGPHTCRLEYNNGIAAFWFDGVLLDSVAYSMPNFKLRLGAFARSNGDSVDATYSSINIVPEPSSLFALAGGIVPLGVILRKRRKK